MKQLLISFLSLVIVLTTPTFGQVDSVTDQYMGNGNLLVNPGLESGLKSWTNVAGTLSIESSVVIKGKRAGKVVLSSQALNLYQDVTSYQAQLADGVQGLASVRIKTSVSGIRLCPRQAGVINSSLCVSVASSNKWGLYKVPFILGATSNGISINSNGTSISGTVYFDDSFMGPQELSLETNACNDVSCETEFSAKISSTAVISGENLDWLDTCSVASGGIYTCNFKAGTFTQNPNCSVLLAVQTVGQASKFVTSSSTQLIYRTTDGSTATPHSVEIICQKQGEDFTNAKQLSNGNTYSSTNADTDWTLATPPTIFGSTTNPTTGTVELNALRWKRSGGDLEMRWQFRQTTAGMAGSGFYYIELPNGLQVDTSRMSNSNVSGFLASVGHGSFSTSSGFFVTAQLQNGTTNRIYFVIGNELTSPSIWGSTVVGLGNSPLNISVNIKVPIQGWQNSNLIIAELNGLQKCESTLDCTDTFSAYITSTATVVSGSENVDFLDGNCTLASTSNYTCSFKSGVFTSAPNCVVSYANASSVYGGRTASIKTVTSSQLTYITEIAGSLNAAAVQIICQKSGADYTGKTARAVANDQNLRTNGVTNSIIFSAKINGATGAITSQLGNNFSSCSRSAVGRYTCNLTGVTYSDCSCTPTRFTAGSGVGTACNFHTTTTATFLDWRTSTGDDTSYADSNTSIICHGIAQ